MTEYVHQLGFWTPGPLEIILILAVLVLVFGRRLPDIARSVGKSFTEFKKGINEAKDSKDEFMDDIRKTKDDVVHQAKEASGLNESDEEQ
jgi:sec-independent protein translocase protein TatA